VIFDCPECDAGHNVPASTIPNGGLDVTCRRCGDGFVAYPDGHVLRPKKDLGSAVVKPALDADADDTALAPPEFDDGEATIEASADELETREQLLAEVLGDPTVDGSVDPTIDGTIDGLGEPTLDAPPVAASENSQSSVYDLVASGEYTPHAVPAHDEPDAPEPPKAWNEPSAPDLRALGPVARAAMALNQAPLAVKAGLLVFPVVLGLTLVLTAPDKGEAPIEIPTQTPAAVAAAARARDAAARPAVPSSTVAPSADPRSETATAPRDDPPPAHALLDDRPAPEGYAYVQGRRVTVRVKASFRARPAGRLKRGRLVRRYDTTGSWALVMVEPNGPAGFVDTRYLGAKKPIATLAKTLAFDACRATSRKARPACRAAAQTQLQQCNEGCGEGQAQDPESAQGRCEAACALAFDRCTSACNARRSSRRAR